MAGTHDGKLVGNREIVKSRNRNSQGKKDSESGNSAEGKGIQ